MKRRLIASLEEEGIRSTNLNLLLNQQLRAMQDTPATSMAMKTLLDCLIGSGLTVVVGLFYSRFAS